VCALPWPWVAEVTPSARHSRPYRRSATLALLYSAEPSHHRHAMVVLGVHPHAHRPEAEPSASSICTYNIQPRHHRGVAGAMRPGPL
jgi:hypothetical protein